MDQQTLMLLGQYLNENLSLETCDNSLIKTMDWLKAMEVDDLDETLEWLAEQGVVCDCEIVIKLYIPAREKEMTSTPTVTD
jgi:hypothetical protein